MGLISVARRVKDTLIAYGVLKSHFKNYNQPLLTDIDWERSIAYVPSATGFPGGYVDIFFKDDIPAERVTELAEDLKRQVDPKSGKPLVNAIYTKEVFGTGPYAPREPHLLVLPSEGITFRMDLGNRRFWDETKKIVGTHQKDGVLYAYGNGIRRNFKAPNAEIYDLVPTVLRSMGLPLPYTFDGRVLDELFVESKQAEQTAVVADNNAKGGLARRKLNKLLEV